MVKTVVLGSINMDLVVNTDRVPNKGETLIGNKFASYPGGKGANQAIAISRQGGDVSMIAKIGNGEFGDKLINNLRINNIDVNNISKDIGVSSGIAVIFVEKGGQNRITVLSGANEKVSKSDVIAADDLFNQCNYLVMQLEIPVCTVEYAIKCAKKKNIKTVLNPSPLPTPLLKEKILQSIDYLIVNEIEAEGLTGISVVNVDSGLKAAAILQKRMKGTILLTLGSNGSITNVGEQEWHNPPFHVESIDSTGAGDAFVGGFIGCLQKGASLKQAVLHGNAAGALATCKAGAQTSLPTYQETETFIKEYSGI